MHQYILLSAYLGFERYLIPNDWVDENIVFYFFKSYTRETLNLLTNADNSTDTKKAAIFPITLFFFSAGGFEGGSSGRKAVSPG